MRRSLRVASLCAVLAIAGTAWFFLAPPPLGGSTSYAVVYGSSMEPHFHRGDLVILRAKPAYRRGEVVAYQSHELRRNVLHRIVGVRGNRFVFKGDNNSFLDPEQPVAGQLFGTEWVALSGVGGLLEHLRSPRNAAIAAGLAVLLIAGGGSGSGVRRRRQHKTEQPDTPDAHVAAAPPQLTTRRRRTGVVSAGVALGLVGLAAIALGTAVGFLALRQPTHRTVSEPRLVVQRGAFSWSGPAPVGAVYQTPSLRPSDPVFLRLVHRLTVRFAYGVQSRFPASFSGSAELGAVLSDGTGWRRRLTIVPERRFGGTHITLAGSLDLRALTAAVARFEAQTGEHTPSYHVELVPQVRVHGVAGGRLVRETFAPSLSFDLDELRLQVAHSSAGISSNSLVRTTAAAGTRTTASTLNLFGSHVSVAKARRLTLGIAGAGLVLALAGGALVVLRRRDDEAAAIERRFGDLIVAVGADSHRPGPERRVATMDALVRVAERYDRLILHESRDGSHSYFVDDGGLVYRYDIGVSSGETTQIGLDAVPVARPVHIRAAD